ncbi:MAG: hypothetical protein RBT65_10120 [Methanolobus sp.]|nr:hypothetical protein [Methanolobus sp.]
MPNPFEQIVQSPYISQYHPKEYVSQYLGLPTDVLMNVSSQLQQRYDTGEEYSGLMKTGIRDMMSNALPGDIEAATQIADMYGSKLSEYEERGDYHNLNKEITATARNFESDYKKIMANRQAVEAAKAQAIQSDKYGNITDDVLADIEERSAIRYNPETKRLEGGYTPEHYAKYIDPVAFIDKLTTGNWAYDQEGKLKYRSVDDIETALKAAIEGSGEMQASLDQEVEFYAKSRKKELEEAGGSQEEIERTLKSDIERKKRQLVFNAIEFGKQKLGFTHLSEESMAAQKKAEEKTKNFTPIISHEIPIPNDVNTLSQYIINEGKPEYDIEEQIKTTKDRLKVAKDIKGTDNSLEINEIEQELAYLQQTQIDLDNIKKEFDDKVFDDFKKEIADLGYEYMSISEFLNAKREVKRVKETIFGRMATTSHFDGELISLYEARKIDKLRTKMKESQKIFLEARKPTKTISVVSFGSDKFRDDAVEHIKNFGGRGENSPFDIINPETMEVISTEESEKFQVTGKVNNQQGYDPIVYGHTTIKGKLYYVFAPFSTDTDNEGSLPTYFMEAPNGTMANMIEAGEISAAMTELLSQAQDIRYNYQRVEEESPEESPDTNLEGSYFEYNLGIEENDKKTKKSVKYVRGKNFGFSADGTDASMIRIDKIDNGFEAFYDDPEGKGTKRKVYDGGNALGELTQDYIDYYLQATAIETEKINNDITKRIIENPLSGDAGVTTEDFDKLKVAVNEIISHEGKEMPEVYQGVRDWAIGYGLHIQESFNTNLTREQAIAAAKKQFGWNNYPPTKDQLRQAFSNYINKEIVTKIKATEKEVLEATGEKLTTSDWRALASAYYNMGTVSRNKLKKLFIAYKKDRSQDNAFALHDFLFTVINKGTNEEKGLRKRRGVEYELITKGN